MLDEGSLQNGELAVLGMALNSADRFAIKAHCRDNAGRACIAGAVRIIDNYCAAQTLRCAAAEFRAGEPRYSRK